MRYFWLDSVHKIKFFDYVSENCTEVYIEEIQEPYFRLTSDRQGVIKLHKYKMDINDEDYTALKMIFNVTEVVW